MSGRHWQRWPSPAVATTVSSHLPKKPGSQAASPRHSRVARRHRANETNGTQPYASPLAKRGGSSATHRLSRSNCQVRPPRAVRAAQRQLELRRLFTTEIAPVRKRSTPPPTPNTRPRCQPAPPAVGGQASRHRCHPRGDGEGNTQQPQQQPPTRSSPAAYHFMPFFRLSLYDLMSPLHFLMPLSTTQISRATCDSRRKSWETRTTPPV